MSKPSAGKKARRQKRVVVRQTRKVPLRLGEQPAPESAPGNITEVILGVGGDLTGRRPHVAALVEVAADLERHLGERGWAFDPEFSTPDGLAGFYFPASRTKFLDENIEPVTRIWMAISAVRSAVGDEGFFPSVHVVLVGSSAVDTDWLADIDDVLERIDDIEAYRAGDPPLERA